MPAVQSYFEQIIRDVEAFRVMMDGAFVEWEGTYDVYLLDTKTNLFTPRDLDNFAPFCKLLRSKPAGDELCHENDARVAAEFEGNDRDARCYDCHAGLIDVAIPIRVEGKLVATVFCGQMRPVDPAKIEKLKQRTAELETQLGFANGELAAKIDHLWEYDEEKVTRTVKRVEHLVQYVSRLGAEHLDIQQGYERELQRLKASVVLQEFSRNLNNLDQSWDQFWDTAGDLLTLVGGILNATCGMILIPRGKSQHHIAIRVFGLPQGIFQGYEYELAPWTQLDFRLKRQGRPRE
ncbi:MAG: PocR ligand-binding domain-containing protein [Anaerolineae bacterium]|nr:PocR ligand-binding domain-containing protein [Anaerolineae bacterium]